MPQQTRTATQVLFPFLRYRDAPAAIDWLVKAFAFKELMVVPNENGTVAHAEVEFDSGVMMLASARDDLATERASVGARQAELVDRTAQVKGLTIDQQKALSDAEDADLVAVIARLTQTQTALQAALAAGAEIARTSLVDLLKL